MKRASLTRIAGVATWVLLVSALSLTARANTASKAVIHKVSDKAESYEDLAEYYYGKRYLALHLRLFNGRAEPLDRGATIIIPTYSLVPVKRGQTLQAFAEANLNDPGRAEYLAELHALKGRDRQNPKPGLKLRIVQSLKHVVRPGETLRSIARAYYRDVSSERLKLVILYNKLSSGTVKSGAALRIPLDTNEFNREAVLVRAKRPFERGAPVAEASPKSSEPPPPALTSAKPGVRRARPRPETAIARAEPDRPPPPPRRTDDDLEDLERLCGDGDYKGCEERARQVLESAPASAVSGRVEVLRLRAVALVALGRNEDSKAAFRQLLKLDPEYDLDLYRTSPKILDVFQAVAER